jgi:DNA-directed RNA polymerase specialized sigma24 family protein
MAQPDNQPSRIDNISTRLSILANPERFVLRYGRAIRSYIGALVRDAHEADDIAQNLLVQVLRKGLTQRAPERGRFRDYLKAVIRNVMADSYRQRRASAQIDLDAVAVSDEAADRQWLDGWRGCILDSAWAALEHHQHAHPGNLGYTALRLTVEHPQESSEQLAARLAKQTGQPMRPDGFRKQLSRARRQFAEGIVKEVRQTLARPTPDQVVEELIAIGLMSYIRPYLAERGSS